MFHDALGTLILAVTVGIVIFGMRHVARRAEKNAVRRLPRERRH